jgi:transcriptional regulator with GAF, ATPase, and Fis domain
VVVTKQSWQSSFRQVNRCLPEETALDRNGRECTVHSAIAELSSALVRGVGIEEMMTALISASVPLVQGAEFAKVSLIEDESLCSLAPTSELAAMLDGAQQAAGQGPCLDAIAARKPINCSDLRTDVRWPSFSRAATGAGFYSVLCYPLDMLGRGGATLSFLGTQPEAFGMGSDATAALLADHAAIALVAAEHERRFKTALAARDIVGQAKGMIMERFRLDPAAAFALLEKMSQQSNTPVAQLAASLVQGARPRDDARKGSRALRETTT